MTTETGDSANTAWMPFGYDENETSAYTALTPGVPDWMSVSLWEWVLDRMSRTKSNEYIWYDVDRLRECSRVLRVPAGYNDQIRDRDVAIRELQRAFGSSDTTTLRLVDYLVSKNDWAANKKLEAILTEAGSAWSVGDRIDRPGLVQRLPDGVVVAAEVAFSHGDAGTRLKSAWEAAFGISPEPESAYSRAVKAVEDAAIPVVSPNNRAATLGTVIKQLRTSGKFELPHLREHPDAMTHDVLIAMMQMLWTGQHDRHGGPSQVPVPNVTQAEAETAVMLAVTLVGWFSTGKVVQ